MDTNALKKFAQEARTQLRKEVAARLAQVERQDSAELREKAELLNTLRKHIQATSKDRVIEEVAYTWFNRFCALRYMDLNDFNRLKVVSPVNGATQPEILQEAKNGYVEDAYAQKRGQIQAYLNGTVPADNPQQEAYRLLLVSVCNELAESMPFLFERIGDYSELLMPMDLLSSSSILHAVRDALTPQACEDVEVIGWLYQFYISEKKDEVMARKSAVPSEDIPAVTQLFTPHWIVRYMVENSLGRLWLLNHPKSRLADKMDYYIKPVEEQTEYLHLASPEEIKLCDPACGSGHILTYAFDLLYSIYEEIGYNPSQIPALILQHNLYGIEIDPRAGSLAAFALYMKAFEKDRRFAKRDVLPNICVMGDISFTSEEVRLYMERLGKDLFTQEVWQAFKQFEHTSTFGSLIRPAIKNPQALLEKVQQTKIEDNLFLQATNRKVAKVLEMCNYLSPCYAVVVANPPYFGTGMDGEFKTFAKDHYPNTKSDTFAMFIERNLELCLTNGTLGFMTPFVWMFLSSYENLRKSILDNYFLSSLVKPSYTSFFASAIVAVVTFVVDKKPSNLKGDFFDLGYLGSAESQPIKLLEAINNSKSELHHRASAADFKKIPGSPIAYWVSDRVREVFDKGICISDIANSVNGLTTGENALFLRNWHEVSLSKIGFSVNKENKNAIKIKKWFPYNKGGDFRKWYGNHYYIINWQNDGKDIILHGRAFPRSKNHYFSKSISWSKISSSKISMRFFPDGFVFDVAGCSIFPNDENDLLYLLAFTNTKVVNSLLLCLSPTLNYESGQIGKLPILHKEAIENDIVHLAERTIQITKDDWDSYETSWEFQFSPLCSLNVPKVTMDSLNEAYNFLRKKNQQMINEMQHLEEEINSIFIRAYGLEGEFTPNVPLNEITLTYNPHYRYPDSSSTKYTDEEREARLLEDTIKEFLSYAVGCMFGRFSLDKPGLVLANQGETLQDFLQQVPELTFSPDEDNILPILEGDWFPDDISNRFRTFLRVTFGDTHYEENLAYIEQALGKDIRTYFVRDFYKDHVQTYKKRPIYWLFTSPKGSFNALIYMHRYRPDTVSTLLNKYLREFQSKLRSRKAYLESVESSSSASKSEQVNARKELRQIDSNLLELREYEDKIIYPLATEQIHIDLDDGVVVNYAKFGSALKTI